MTGPLHVRLGRRDEWGLLVLPEVGHESNDGFLACGGNFWTVSRSSPAQKMGDSLICFGTSLSIRGAPECSSV